MSKQVLSIEQMQHLKELGVDTKTASLCWVCLNSEPYLSFYNKDYPQDDEKVIPAFTLQNIMDLLPTVIPSQDVGDDYWLEFGKSEKEDNTLWYVRYMSLYGNCVNYEKSKGIIDSAYSMLCWCIVNGYVKTNNKP